MELREFVKQLAIFFNMGGNEEHKRLRMEQYVDLIEETVFNTYGTRYNYKALLKKLQLECDKMPTTSKIFEYLYVGRVINESYSGREGEVIKRTVNGVEYEFTIVPNHWEKVKTIEQLDQEIMRRCG